MTFDQVLYFLSVVNQGSFTKAATAMKISQQSLSASMRSLENELGKTLFRRSNKGVTLTKDGETFHIFAREAWGAYERMQSRMNPEQPPAPPMRLRIGTSDVLTATFLPPFLIEFGKTHPRIELKVFNEPASTLIEWVGDGKIDCALVMLMAKDDDPATLSDERIVDQTLVACRSYYWVSTDSPLAQQKSISLKQAAAEPMVFKQSADVEMADRFFAGYDLNILDFPLSTDTDMIVEIVANGMAILSDVRIGNKELTMTRQFSGQPVVAVPLRLPSSTHLDVHFIANAQTADSEAVSAFRTDLMKYAGSTGK